jgi:hypothetical protein
MALPHRKGPGRFVVAVTIPGIEALVETGDHVFTERNLSDWQNERWNLDHAFDSPFCDLRISEGFGS